MGVADTPAATRLQSKSAKATPSALNGYNSQHKTLLDYAVQRRMPPNNAVQHRKAASTTGEVGLDASGGSASSQDMEGTHVASLEIESDHEPLLERQETNGILSSLGGGHAAGAHHGTASSLQVAFNMVISFVGAGMLGMPHAFAESGWILGNIALAVVSSANVYAMLLLVQCRQRLENNMDKTEAGAAPIDGYGDVGRVVMGPTGELVVNVCLVVSQVGFATAYLIFVAANAWKMAAIPRGEVCLACVPLLAIFVQAREMRTLSPTSFIADIANFLALSAILVQDYRHVNHEPNVEDFEEEIVAADYSNLLYVVAISLYSLEGVGMILPLEGSAKDRKHFPSLLTGVIVGITVFMGLFGTAGYWAFGNETLAPITLNMTGNAGTFVQIALCLALYLTYPIMMVPVHGVMERLWPSLTTSAPLRVATRSSLVAFTAWIAYAVPDFGKFLSLVGSSICVLLGFIFPCYFHLKVFGFDQLPWWQIVLNVFLIVGGTIFGIIGTYQSFVALLNGEAVEHVRHR